MSRAQFTLCIALLAGIMLSCSGKDEQFVLNGTVLNGGADSLLITGMDSRFDRVDTIRMEDGHFSYSCLLDTVTPLLLFYPDGRQDVIFADKGQTTTLLKDSTDSPATIDGGVWNEQFAGFLADIAHDTAFSQTENHIDSFIQEHPLSEVSPYLIYRYYLQAKDLDRQRILDLTDRMSGQMHDNAFVADLRNKAREGIGNNLLPGYIALTDTSLERKTLDNIHDKGNMLICVWASWDSVSRRANKEISSIRDKYKDKRITLAGISIDVNRKRWKEAVMQDSLDWQQYDDTDGWSSILVTQHRIDHLPYYFLIGAQHRIIAKGENTEIIERRINSLD